VLALEVSHLRVVYGHIVAVDDVSLCVNEGEIVAMIGGNGAGKSSILRAVTGMLRPAAGTLRGPGGIDLLRLPPHRFCREGIALVPSERQVFREMSVLENLEMGGYSLGSRSELDHEVERVLARFPALRERLSHLAGNLSGGQQQQVAIARALMAKPKLIVMDEPSLGLAPRMVDEVFELVRTIHAEGHCVLLVEQNAKRALEVSHRAYVMRAGQLTAEGDSQALLRDPAIVEAYMGRVAQHGASLTRH
jgi:branched-chain amino acid transport system ATP-binding protein